MCDVSTRDQAESNTQAASIPDRPRPHQRPDEPARVPASGGEEGGVSDWSIEKYDTLMNDMRKAVQEHIIIVGELDRGIQALCAMRNRIITQERN